MFLHLKLELVCQFEQCALAAIHCFRASVAATRQPIATS
jgi:hypothetical protein